MMQGEPEYPSDTSAVLSYRALAGMGLGAIVGMVLIFILGIMPLASTDPDSFAVYAVMFGFMFPGMAACEGWILYRWRNPVYLIMTVRSPSATRARLSGNWKDPATTLARTFSDARTAAPAVILLENASALSAIARSSEESARRTFSALLMGLEQTMPGQRIAVILTSSDPLEIPAEMFRENRISRSVVAFQARPEERARLIRSLLRSKPVDSDVTPQWLESVASSTNINEIERLVKDATVKALVRAMKTRAPARLRREDLSDAMQNRRESSGDPSADLQALEIKAESALREAFQKAGLPRSESRVLRGFDEILESFPGGDKTQERGGLLVVGARADTVAALIASLALDSDVTLYHVLCAALAAKIARKNQSPNKSTFQSRDSR